MFRQFYILMSESKVFFMQQNLIYTTSKCQKNYQLANAFIKMSDKFGHKKNRTKPYFAANVSQPDAAVKSVIQEKRRRFVRRENVLNKVFMSHITDFMSDGIISDALVGKGIEITKVKVSPDFQLLYVFWIARDGQNDAEIQEVLDSYAFPIRDLLSQLRVVGSVPKIMFIKDKFKGRLSEINNILNQADFGEDFTPVYPSLLNTDHMRLSDPKTLEDLALDDLGELPAMRQDVFKLNHAAIMSQIEKVVLKSKALHRKKDFAEPMPGPTQILGDGHHDDAKLAHVKEPDPSSDPSPTYAEYLRTQNVAKAKMRKEKLVELVELENELTQRLGSMEVDSEEEEEDYLEEDCDDKSANR